MSTRTPMPNILDGEACAKHGWPATSNPHPFDTQAHYLWLADWNKAMADSIATSRHDRPKHRQLEALYRNQASAVSLTQANGKGV